MFNYVNIIFVIFCVHGALAQTPVFDGTCPQPAPLASFNIDDFIGKWYAYAKYPIIATNEANVVPDRKCVYANYANLGGGNVAIDGFAIDTNTGAEVSQHWDSTLVAPGQFSIPNAAPQTLNSLNVLKTDFTNYASLYACIPLSANQYRVEAWVVSRTQTLADDFLIEALQSLKDMDLETGLLVPYDQTDCPV